MKLDVIPMVSSALYRKQVSSFEPAVKSGEDLLIGCTQEAPLFAELHKELNGINEIPFVNVRETAGWSEQGAQSAPKMAALLALADLPELEPVPVVPYRSNGHTLVIGRAEAALSWADRLAVDRGHDGRPGNYLRLPRDSASELSMHDMNNDARVASPPEEEQSRSDPCELLSRLFYAAPDAALLAGLVEIAGPEMDKIAVATPGLAQPNRQAKHARVHLTSC